MLGKIFICHYKPLKERKKILSEQLNKLGLDYEWVEIYDREEIDINKLKTDLPNMVKPLNIIGHQNRTLRMSEISLILKHNYIWEKMIKDDIDNVLVLEDDALLDNDFVEKYYSYTRDLPEDYDLLWVGSCCGLHAPNISLDKHIYQNDGSRCTHAYLISKKCASKMIEQHKINNSPADFMFNEAIRICGLKNYWLEPDLVSQNNLFNTTIQNDNKFI